MNKLFISLLSISILSLLVFTSIYNSVKAQSSTPVQETITINSSADTYISEYRPTIPWGTSNYMDVGRHRQGDLPYAYDILIKFDLSQIPQGSTINSANITLKRHSLAGIPSILKLYPIRTSWSESTVNWNNRPPSDTSSYVSNVADPSWDKFYVTNYVQNMVRNSNPTPNYGFYILSPSVNSFFSLDYYTKEYGTNKPTLTITFTRPTPAASSSPYVFPRLSISPLASPRISIPPLYPTDNIAPTISNITYTKTHNTATIYWRTDEDSQGKVLYGRRGFWDLESQPTATGQTHSVTLTNLNPSTEYNFKIRAADRWINTRYSGVYTFTTNRTTSVNPSPLPSRSPSTSPSPSPTTSGGGSGTGGLLCGIRNFFSFSRCTDPLVVNPFPNPSATPNDPNLPGGAAGEDNGEGNGENGDTPPIEETPNDPDNPDTASPDQTEPTEPDTPKSPVSDVPIVGSLFDTINKALEDKLSQATINSFEKSREATEGATTALDTKNPLVLIGSYLGVNRIVGIALVVIGIVMTIVALIMLKLSHKTYHKVKKHLVPEQTPKKLKK